VKKTKASELKRELEKRREFERSRELARKKELEKKRGLAARGRAASAGRALAFVVTTALALASLATAARAEEFRPLAGSEWAARHPGQLPYSRCELVHDWKEALAGEAGLIVSIDRQAQPLRSSSVLVCRSDKLKLAYTIPVEVSAGHGIGLTAGVSWGFARASFAGASLDRHHVSDLFGSYRGLSINLKFIIGAGAQWLRHDGIRLHVGNIGAGVELDLSGRSVKIARKADFDYGELSKETFVYDGDGLKDVAAARSYDAVRSPLRVRSAR